MKRSRIRETFRRLFDFYGPQHWWPSRTGDPWEIVCGAVLTQNCAWRNVEKALDGLAASGLTTPETVLSASDEALQRAVRPAGFFRQKSASLREIAKFHSANSQEYAAPCASPEELTLRRTRLLAVRGIGKETADDILLYAFHHPVFVVDAYARRVAERHWGVADAARMPYDVLSERIRSELPCDVELYAEYHALLTRLCKDSCRKKTCGEACGRIFPL